MKTFYSFSSLLLLSMFLFMSCQSKVEYLPQTTFQIDQIGKEHNKGLDYVLSYIKINKNKIMDNSKGEFLKIAQEGTKEYFYKGGYLVSSSNITLANQEASSVYKYYKDINYENESLKKLWPMEKDALLSDLQKQFLNEIQIAIDDQTMDLSATLNVLTKIEKKSIQKCSHEDQYLILSTLSIAKNSLQYWHDNYNDWTYALEDLYNLSHQKIQLRRWFSWKAVAKNDIAYGAGGALAGALVGGAVSVGTLSIPGYAAGAIGGAVGGSVGNAGLQILDRIW